MASRVFKIYWSLAGKILQQYGVNTPTGADGSYVVRFDMPAGARVSIDLSQSLGVTFLANSIDTLSFEIDAGSTVTSLSDCSISLEADDSFFGQLSARRHSDS